MSTETQDIQDAANSMIRVLNGMDTGDAALAMGIVLGLLLRSAPSVDYAIRIHEAVHKTAVDVVGGKIKLAEVTQ